MKFKYTLKKVKYNKCLNSFGSSNPKITVILYFDSEGEAVDGNFNFFGERVYFWFI